MTDATTKNKPGRKPSPINPALSRYQKAQAAAEKARKAYTKTQDIVAALEAAETEERQAYDELQAVLANTIVPPPEYSADEDF